MGWRHFCHYWHEVLRARACVCLALWGPGVYEALELRDKDPNVYMGKGVLKAVSNVNSIIGPALLGRDPTAQKAIDDFMVQTLDGSKGEWGWVHAHRLHVHVPQAPRTCPTGCPPPPHAHSLCSWMLRLANE
jgi:hypothetical protein